MYFTTKQIASEWIASLEPHLLPCSPDTSASKLGSNGLLCLGYAQGTMYNADWDVKQAVDTVRDKTSQLHRWIGAGTRRSSFYLLSQLKACLPRSYKRPRDTAIGDTRLELTANLGGQEWLTSISGATDGARDSDVDILTRWQLRGAVGTGHSLCGFGSLESTDFVGFVEAALLTRLQPK